jgi:hypothetical protein
MIAAWIAPLAAIAGTIVGTLGSYALQRAQWKREKDVRWDAARREAYGRYLGHCNIYHGALLEVGGAVRHKRNLSPNSFDSAWQLANSRKSEALAAYGEVSVLADERVKEAAETLSAYLERLNRDLHYHNVEGTDPKSDWEYRKIYGEMATRFAGVAASSLGIDRVPVSQQLQPFST